MSDNTFKVIKVSGNRHCVWLNGKPCVLYIDNNKVITGGYFTGSGKRGTQNITERHTRLWKAAMDYVKTL